MDDNIVQLISIFVSFLASQGLWTYVNNRFTKKEKGARLLLALAHDKLTYLSEKAIERGYIGSQEYRILIELYDAYVEYGGNGMASRLMEHVQKLPIQNKQGEQNNETIKPVV